MPTGGEPAFAPAIAKAIARSTFAYGAAPNAANSGEWGGHRFSKERAL